MSGGETALLSGFSAVVGSADKSTREQIADAVRTLGLRVIEAESGPSVVKALRAQQPVLLFLDSNLGDKTTFEICRKVRRAPKLARIPVIVAIDETSESSAQKAFDAGATDFVAKPVDIKAFMRHLRHVLRAHQHHEALMESEARNRSLIAAIPDRIVLVDRTGTIVQSLSQQDDGVNSLTELIPDGDVDRVIALIGRSIDIARTCSAELVASSTDNAYAEARIVPHGKQHALIMLRDISEHRRAEAKLQKLTEFDELTGLPNRAFFTGLLAQAVELASRRGRKLAVLALDLDRFLRINSTLGRDAGDDCLRQLARRLHLWRGRWNQINGLRREPVVARLGSDEFAVLLNGLDNDDAVYGALESLRSTFEEPLRWQDKELVVSFTAGIAVYPDEATDPSKLVDQAEAAGARAKSDSQAGEHKYSGVQDAREFDRMYLEKELRRALDEQELHLVYQPKINLQSGRMTAVEALARWQHPVRGAISPGDFVPIAEELGLSDKLGGYVLRLACKQLAKWQSEHEQSPGIAVNVSAKQFTRGSIIEEVRSVLSETNVRPESLEIEVTEGALMSEDGSTDTMLANLKKLGVRISVDDFGTGYSSLSYLKRFPIDALKIDQSFVADLDDDSESRAIVQAVIAMGHGLSLEVIAEGIERRSQFEALRDLGCDIGQGYWFSKGISAAECEVLISRNFLKPQSLPWEHQSLAV